MLIRTLPLKLFVLLILLLASIIPAVIAQQPVLTREQQLIKKEVEQRAKNPITNFSDHKEYTAPFFQPYSTSPNVTSNPYKQERIQNGECNDSSFIKLFESTQRSYSFFCSAKTADGGILIGGFGKDLLQGPPYKWMSVLTKFDSIGNHLWSREIVSDVSYGLYIESIKELSDGSIIITGWHDNNLYSSPPSVYSDFFVVKLTSIGNITWFKTFHSLLNNNCTSNNLRFISIAEGANGELLFAGTNWNCPYPKNLVVFKLNSNGIVQWKYSFQNQSKDSYAVGIFYDNNEVTVINKGSNIGSGTDDVIHIDFLKLDYSTGTLLSYKAWRVDMNYPASFDYGFVNDVTAIRLANGNYCVYGRTFGGMSISAPNLPHFAVLEFNSVHDFAKGYTINSSIVGNYYESRIKMNRFGQAVYVLTTIFNYPDKDKYIGASDNGFIVNQRFRKYRNREIFYDNFEIFDDGSYAFIANLSTIGQSNFFLEYSLLHNSDVGSLCLGESIDFSFTSPVYYVPYNFTWAQILSNPFSETNNQNNTTIPLDYVASVPCFQKSFCDTLKIHGTASSCDLQQVFTFTTFKNMECGSGVKWKIDPSVTQLFQVVNDTTVNIRFNQQWQGWLYSEINTTCGLVKDSLLITVYNPPGAVNLGADTIICPSNSLTLNAHKGFTNYVWNDGSVDSLLTVTLPGTYYVDVTDACGNTFSDTIKVTAAPPIPFSIGPDRTKCNSDTLHIVAPGGFLNYNWGPSYKINTLTGSQVVVQPAIDTIYFVKAEKTPGCFAYDTVRITVKQSLPIDLGADKSFCTGDSALLDAGSSFSQYTWSNGSAAQQIKVYSPGSYSVIGATTNGCKSYDTLKIVNVWANPIVNLNDDTQLCAGSSRVLQAGNYSSYLWQNGSVSPSFTVTGLGKYFVTVWDNNQCKGSDTVVINQLVTPPANFLPADTVICNYGSLLIKPVNSYTSYNWNNNAISPSIIISRPGTYWLQVKDQNNCSGKDSIIVTLKECLKGFYIPTGFTPDNNGRNDYFKPFIGGLVKQYQFTVYNRWGEVVFTTQDLYKGWDGRLGNIPQDSNIFVWVCIYQIEGEEVKKEKGTVILIR